MRRGEDGAGIAEAVRAHIYGKWPGKESRKCWERVTYMHTSTAQGPHGAKERTMSPTQRDAKKQAKIRQRHRLKARERLERDRRQAQHAAEALQQALDDLGLPEDLVTEIEGRLRSQKKLLGKIVGMMCPPLFGCRTNTELCRVRGWDKNLPARLLGALPKRSWIKRLRRLGLEVLEPLWRHAASKSAATRSRWQWTWVADDSVVKKYGEQLGLVGTWWSGQEHRVLSGIDGVLLVVVIGDGKREQGDAGDYAAIGIASTSRSMSGYQRLKMAPSSPLRVRTRVCNNKCAPSLDHCICCFLQNRLLTTSFTVDSTNPVAIASPWRYRSP